MNKSSGDPCLTDARKLSRDERDLMILARKTWVQAFDNVSRIPAEMSDDLCRLSTGAAFMTRQLHTDMGEIILTARRPVLLNGIADVIERPDLVSRSIYIWTKKLQGTKQLTEKDFWARFNEACPRLLGALLKAVSHALRHQNDADATPEDLPRMADAVVWVTAGEEAFGWKRGTFLAAYRRNVEMGVRIAIGGDPLGDAICAFMSAEQKGINGKVVAPRLETWKGSATELLAALRIVAGDGVRQREWPKSPNRLAQHLRPLIPALEAIGIFAEISRTHNPRRITLSWTPLTPATAMEETSESPPGSQTSGDPAAPPVSPVPESGEYEVELETWAEEVSDPEAETATIDCIEVKL